MKLEDIENPFRNEHAARLHTPNFDQYRRTKGGTLYGSKHLPETVSIIWGHRDSDPASAWIPQTLRFPTSTWSAKEARKFLKDNDIHPIKFEPAIMDKEQEIKNDKSVLDIYIKGIIEDAFGDEMANQITNAANAGIQNLTIHINSYGGSVKAALDIVSAFKNTNMVVTAINEGFAVSAASIILAAADKAYAFDYSTCMIHNPLMGDRSLNDTQGSDRELLTKIKDGMINIYKKRMNVDSNKISKMLNDETSLNAEDQKRLGLVDSIIIKKSKPKIAAQTIDIYNIESIYNIIEKFNQKTMKKQISNKEDQLVKRDTQITPEEESTKEANPETPMMNISKIKCSVCGASMAHKITDARYLEEAPKKDPMEAKAEKWLGNAIDHDQEDPTTKEDQHGGVADEEGDGLPFKKLTCDSCGTEHHIPTSVWEKAIKDDAGDSNEGDSTPEEDVNMAAGENQGVDRYNEDNEDDANDADSTGEKRNEYEETNDDFDHAPTIEKKTKVKAEEAMKEKYLAEINTLKTENFILVNKLESKTSDIVNAVEKHGIEILNTLLPFMTETKSTIAINNATSVKVMMQQANALLKEQVKNTAGASNMEELANEIFDIKGNQTKRLQIKAEDPKLYDTLFDIYNKFIQ